MEDEGIEDEAGLQTYLTLRIGRHLEAKGRRLIGWDEILDGELAPGAVVMSWRGTRGGIAAARRRHEVIMTPSTYLYFDKKATDSYDEPVSLSSSLLPLEKIYGYDPDEGIAPEDRRYLLGVQANLWTEFIRTEGRASFQLLPRIYALAEIAWSPVERKSWREFSGPPRTDRRLRRALPPARPSGHRGRNLRRRKFLLRHPASVSRLQSPLHAQRRRTAGFRP